MSVEDLRGLVSLLSGDGAAVAMFALFVVGLMREWWVMGVSYRAAVAERDRAIASEHEWRGAAFKERHLATRALDVATP